MSTSRQVRLARRPDGEPTDDTFAFEEHELPELEDGQLLLRVVYLSLDPYMRGRLSDAASYADPVEIGDVIVGGTVCVVEESRDPSYDVGDVVLSYSGWQTHAIARCRPRPQARSLERADLDRTRACSACPGSRRTPDCWRSASRNPARPSWWRPRPAPSDRPWARSPRSRVPAPSASPAARRSARRCSTSSASTSPSTTAPPPSPTTWPPPCPTASTSTSRTSAAR